MHVLLIFSVPLWTGGLLSRRLGPLPIRLGRVFAILDDQIDRVLRFTSEVSLDNVLCAVGVALLRIERGTAD